MKVTIKDIAERAGVHRATVDKVLHNRPGVSDEVRMQIKKLIEEMGYVPNPAGRVLQKQGKVYRLAAILCDVDAEPFLRAGIRKGVEQHSDFDIEVAYRSTSFRNAEEQSFLIDKAVEDKVDGIILSPINSDKVRRAINRAAEKGISVVTCNSDIADSRRLCYVGLDGVRASRIAGRLVGQFLDGKGDIAIISSAIAEENNNYFVTIRDVNFRKFIRKAYPELNIVECIESFEDPHITYEKTCELLKKHPDLRAIYITCGGVAEVGRAVKDCGMANKLRVFSYEDYPEILELMREGIIDVTLGSELERQGSLPVSILMKKMIFNELPECEQLFTNIQILVKECIE